MISRMKAILLGALCIFSASTLAATLSDIKVENGDSQATVTLSFNGQPVYGFFPLHNPNRVVLDIRQSGAIKGLPLNFSGENIVQRIRNSQPKDKQSIRLVFELTQAGKTRSAPPREGNQYRVEFTIKGTQRVRRSQTTAPVTTARESESAANPFNANPVTTVSNSNTTVRPGGAVSRNEAVIVASDAGHGGQEPAASCLNG